MSPDFLDIVVPCYNEAANVAELVSRIEVTLQNVENLEYGILIVDDGSSDSTPSVVKDARLTNPRVGLIRLLRNFGHQAALSAGLEYARGDAVVVMDADLQHPPELLPEMIKQWRSGFDVVQTVRTVQPGVLKSLTSRAFYRLLNYVSEVRIRDGSADFRLMSRRAVDGLLALPERTRFLRGLVTWLGFPSVTIPFQAPPRHSGRSSYGLRKMASLATDALVTLSSRPLHLALYAAALTLCGAGLYGGYVAFQFAHGAQLVRGWTSTIFLVLILGSVNLLCTGILGLYLRAVLVEVRRRPAYLIADYVPPMSAGAPNEPVKKAGAVHFLPERARGGR